MRLMEIDRRRLLALFAAGLVAPPAFGRDVDDGPLFLSARTVDAKHQVVVFDRHGIERRSIAVNDLGHSFAVDPARRKAVAFDRAPGTHAVMFDIDGRAASMPLVANDGRHFFGHGIFSRDGALLFASENDFDGGRGVIGVYDVARGLARIGEFKTAGIGPHDIVAMPDGRTACVANGGILTHPDYDGLKLNLDSMEPSLVYFDLATGDVVETVGLDKSLSRLSIRHLAVDRYGSIWFGCQYEGNRNDRPPLVGRHRRGREPELFGGPPDLLRALGNYVGSVAVDLSGEIVATSSPLGGIIAFWDAATGRSLGSTPLADGCGIAPLEAGLVIASSGRGTIAEIDIARLETRQVVGDGGRGWDNHIRKV